MPCSPTFSKVYPWPEWGKVRRVQPGLVGDGMLRRDAPLHQATSHMRSAIGQDNLAIDAFVQAIAAWIPVQPSTTPAEHGAAALALMKTVGPNS